MGKQKHFWGLTGLLIATFVAWGIAIWGAWVPDRSVANTLLGVDMAEAIKFLPGIRSGRIRVWREAFLLPQLTLSIMLAVQAWQKRWPFPTWLRVGIQVIALMTALSMLPPAWSPPLLRAPEWRTQVLFILTGVAFSIASPLFQFISAKILDGLVALLGLVTATLVGSYLQTVWPEFTAVYHRPLPFGVGVWALGFAVTGQFLVATAGLKAAQR